MCLMSPPPSSSNLQGNVDKTHFLPKAAFEDCSKSTSNLCNKRSLCKGNTGLSILQEGLGFPQARPAHPKVLARELSEQAGPPSQVSVTLLPSP